MQITVIERAQQIQIQEQEIIRRERELEATIRKPAEAEKYRLEKIADANRSVMTCATYAAQVIFFAVFIEVIVYLSRRGCIHYAMTLLG